MDCQSCIFFIIRVSLVQPLANNTFVRQNSWHPARRWYPTLLSPCDLIPQPWLEENGANGFAGPVVAFFAGKANASSRTAQPLLHTVSLFSRRPAHQTTRISPLYKLGQTNRRITTHRFAFKITSVVIIRRINQLLTSPCQSRRRGYRSDTQHDHPPKAWPCL